MKILDNYTEWLKESRELTRSSGYEITLKPWIVRPLGMNSTICPGGGEMRSYTVYLNGEEIIGRNKFGMVGSKEGGILQAILPNNNPDIAFVENINIPEGLRGKGIGAKIYQALANEIKRTIVSSSDSRAAGPVASQTSSSEAFWAKHKEFKPQ